MAVLKENFTNFLCKYFHLGGHENCKAKYTLFNN